MEILNPDGTKVGSNGNVQEQSSKDNNGQDKAQADVERVLSITIKNGEMTFGIPDNLMLASYMLSCLSIAVEGVIRAGMTPRKELIARPQVATGLRGIYNKFMARSNKR